MDHLAALFAGPRDPNASREDNAEATRAGLIRAGLTTLAANATGETTSLGAIATGALAGQATGAAHRAFTLRRALESEYAQLTAGEIDLPKLRRMHALAVRLGDADRMTSLAEVIKATEAAQSQRKPSVQLLSLNGRGYVIDAEGNVVRELEGGEELEPRDLGGSVGWFKPDGTLVRETPKTAAPKTLTPGRPMAVVDPSTGQERLGVWNPTTRQYEWVDGALPATRSSTEDARKAQGFLQFIPDHIAFLDGLDSAPGRMEQALSDRGIREFTNEEQQRLQLAGGALAEAWLRMTTGAAYSEREFQTAMDMFVPRAGDRRATLNEKRRNRERLVGMLRARAGSHATGDSSAGAGLGGGSTGGRAEAARRSNTQASRTMGAGGGVGGVTGGVVTSTMGDPRDGGAREHAGIDVRAPRGTPIAAVHGGVIEVARSNAPRGGRTVTLRLDDGRRVYYGHLDSWAEGIRQGARVRPGQAIGTVGNSGNARDTVSHVHIQAWDANGNLVDPRTVLGNTPQPVARPSSPDVLSAFGADDNPPPRRTVPGGDAASQRRPPQQRAVGRRSMTEILNDINREIYGGR